MTATFTGQPGAVHDDPQTDTSMMALSDALTFLASAALVAETSEAGRTDGFLDAAEDITLGFPAGSDIARGLHLITGAVLDTAAGAS